MKARPWRAASGYARSVAGYDGWSNLGGGRRCEAWRWSLVAANEADGGRRAKDDPQSNKRMHATADTTALKFLQGAGRRVMRSVRRLRNL
jgi:hypothetical protein